MRGAVRELDGKSLTPIGEGAAEAGGVGDGIEGEDRRFGAGEEGDLQIAAGDVGSHPLCVFGAAEGVVVEEAAGRGHGDVIEDSCGPGIDVGIEGGTHFGGLQGARLDEWKDEEVDGEFTVRKGDVAGDGTGGAAGGAPIALVLGCGDEGGSENQEGGGEECAGLHSSRMTLRGGAEQMTGWRHG